jgi:hypothetical protein
MADDAQEPIVEARSTLSLDIEHWIRNTGMHNFWLEMYPFIPGHRWAARLRLAGVKSLLQWWGDRLPLYCMERAILHLWGCSHKVNYIPVFQFSIKIATIVRHFKTQECVKVSGLNS